MKKINYIILGFVGLSLVLTAGFVIAEKPQAKELSRAVLKIDSLSCGGCFSTINAGLAPLEGYSGMGANLFRKLIAIDFVAPLTAEKISQTFIDIGYPGKLETVEAISKEESFAYIESKRTGFISGGGSCGGGYPGRSSGNQGLSGKAPSSSGSCCPQPGGSQPTQDL
ncbi:MAG: heavy-metal-associated domain-containing protein [Proteobacteria bacterium]|nr:heavy-metal-associated domain-containing protein [Pseudomonadota bacterium]MBU1697864.1 heavy-metal-associated domain-containing protein [Pseudomonadota bacterium]